MKHQPDLTAEHPTSLARLIYAGGHYYADVRGGRWSRRHWSRDTAIKAALAAGFAAVVEADTVVARRPAP